MVWVQRDHGGASATRWSMEECTDACGSMNGRSEVMEMK